MLTLPHFRPCKPFRETLIPATTTRITLKRCAIVLTTLAQLVYLLIFSTIPLPVRTQRENPCMKPPSFVSSLYCASRDVYLFCLASACFIQYHFSSVLLLNPSFSVLVKKKKFPSQSRGRASHSGIHTIYNLTLRLNYSQYVSFGGANVLLQKLCTLSWF